MLTAEDVWRVENYLWTETLSRVLFRLKTGDRGLIAIIGLQGIGKTSALYVLEKEMAAQKKECFFIKWTDNWKEIAMENLPNFYKVYKNTLESELDFHEKKRFRNIEQAEKQLGARIVKETKRDVLMSCLGLMDFLFIDFPDYSKQSRSKMNADLNEFQSLWNELLNSGFKTVFVAAIQKELTRTHRHFLWGKMNKFELRPLTSEELMSVYYEKFGSYEPFEDDALRQVAKLSRGIFRRFLKYVEVCVMNHVISQKIGFINVQEVTESVTLKQLSDDMELELCDIFKKRDQRYTAVRILKLLSQIGELNQKQIANRLGLTEATTSRILNRLHDYVIKTRGTKNTWLVSLR